MRQYGDLVPGRDCSAHHGPGHHDARSTKDEHAVGVEAEDVVANGEIDPDHIITPGIFVDRIVKLETVDKRIEQRTVRKRAAAAGTGEEV